MKMLSALALTGSIFAMSSAFAAPGGYVGTWAEPCEQNSPTSSIMTVSTFSAEGKITAVSQLYNGSTVCSGDFETSEDVTDFQVVSDDGSVLTFALTTIDPNNAENRIEVTLQMSYNDQSADITILGGKIITRDGETEVPAEELSDETVTHLTRK